MVHSHLLKLVITELDSLRLIPPLSSKELHYLYPQKISEKKVMPFFNGRQLKYVK